MPKKIHLLSYAVGLGAGDRRCAEGPHVLARSSSFQAMLKKYPGITWADPISIENASALPASDLPSMLKVSEKLAKQSADAVKNKEFFITLGGDHSSAIGTWSGVAHALGTEHSYGLLWFDAHLDAHTFETTPSGNIHGMPVACLLGHGYPTMTTILDKNVKLQPEHLIMIGIRSYEPGEHALLTRLGVRIYDMKEICERGFSTIFQEALNTLRSRCDYYGITLDLDGIDAKEAPGVGTPAYKGVAANDLLSALNGLKNDAQWIGAEVVEFNPAHDQEDKTLEITTKIVDTLLHAKRSTQNAMSTAIELENQFGAPNYHPLPVVLTQGKGVHVQDENGKKYIDMMSAYSAVSHGHCHPRLLQTLTEQAAKLAVVSRAYHHDQLGKFLEKACRMTGLDMALPMNTGAEAVETAIKAARKWGYEIKGVPDNQAEIIVAQGNFHGRTTTIISASSEFLYKKHFGPLTAGFVMVPYGDDAALQKAITPNTVAFLIEPIQGEAGIIIPPSGYLKRCEAICRQHQVLLIADEIQTGLGRTGALLACDHENVKPDGLILGKALGGGFLPISLFLSKREVMELFTPGTHGSTFGGNALAAAVGYEALSIIEEDDYPARSAILGKYFLEALQKIQHPAIVDVRGKGLFVGIEFDYDQLPAREVCLALLQRGILSKETHQSVVRLAPPLIIEKTDLDKAINIIQSTIESL